MSVGEKKALVTGHNGFIGRRLCQVLVTMGWRVVGLGRGPGCSIESGFVSYELDILNRVDVANLIVEYSPKAIIHLAGGPVRVPGHRSFRDCFENNFQGSWNIIEAALRVSNLEKFVFLGSCEEYGSIAAPFDESARELPTTAYGLAKLSVTHCLQALARTHDFQSVILRPSVVYGPGQQGTMFLPTLISSLLNDQVFDMSNGDQTRDFIYIDDLVNAIALTMLASDIGGEIINISSCLPTPIGDLARVVASLIDCNAITLINFGAIGYKFGDSMNYYANNAKSRVLLGWTPEVTLTDGIGRTIEWQRLQIEERRKSET
jgi:UDP-glucose 4-epimerase